jgi:hypothetical protein
MIGILMPETFWAKDHRINFICGASGWFLTLPKVKTDVTIWAWAPGLRGSLQVLVFWDLTLSFGLEISDVQKTLESSIFYVQGHSVHQDKTSSFRINYFSLILTHIGIYVVCLFVSLAVQPSAGYGLLVPRGFVITHNDAPQSVGLLLDEWSARSRDLYLTTLNRQNRLISMPPVGFETPSAVG